MSGPGELELRFLVDAPAAESVLAIAGEHVPRDVRDPARPVAYYRTLYLDTPDRRYLRSLDPSGAQHAAAHRLRVRQYADAADLDDTPRVSSAAFLELKRSVGARRHKVRVELPCRSMARVLAGRPDPSAEARLAEAPPLAALVGDFARRSLVPQVLTWYRRLTLADAAIRVTFDEGIAYCRPERLLAPGASAEPRAVLARESRAVLEVKLRGELPGWLERALLPLAGAGGISKFRAAMDAAARTSLSPATLPLPVLGRR